MKDIRNRISLLFYILMRDHIPTGALIEAINTANGITNDEYIIYTNQHLQNIARAYTNTLVQQDDLTDKCTEAIGCHALSVEEYRKYKEYSDRYGQQKVDLYIAKELTRQVKVQFISMTIEPPILRHDGPTVVPLLRFTILLKPKDTINNYPDQIFEAFKKIIDSQEPPIF